MEIQNNDNLKNMDGLNHLTSVGGSLRICGNEKLQSLNLEELISVSNDFTVFENCSLPIGQATQLRDQVLGGDGVGGEITIRCNYDESYPGPAWVGNYTIRDNSDVKKLSSYTYVTGDLKIADSEYNEFERLTNLTRVGCSLIIQNNHTLTNLTCFENLTTIDGNLVIINNDALTNLAGLENLTSTGNLLSIRENDVLMTLNLDKLCSVGGDVQIKDHDELCENLAIDLKNQIETCPEGGVTNSHSEIDIANNKDCSSNL